MKKITLGILAHVDAGKTTLAEAMLYTSGAIRKQGRVDSRDTALDTHTLEKERGITIFAGEADICFKNSEITLLDTPGHVDFSAETERVLNVLDCALLVIGASDGVEAHTRTLLKLLKTYNIPTFIFVTKCDMNRFERGEIMNAISLEVGAAVDFLFENGKFVYAEKIAESDERLLEEYLSFEGFSDAAIADAIGRRKIFPCFFGSGLKGEGVAELLSAIDRFNNEKDFGSAFGGRVYKIARDKTERITKLRVTGGVLKVKDTVTYGEKAEKINEIRIYSGNKYKNVTEAPAGTVCAVTGLSATYAGQGLGFEKDCAGAVLEPVISYRIVLPPTANPHTMLANLKLLEEEDPKLKFTYNEKIGEFHCALMGKVQGEILKSVIKERFGVDIEIAEGRVLYKETVTDTVEGIGHYEPLRHYSEVHLKIEPAPPGSGVLYDCKVSEAELAFSWQRLIMTHLAEKEHLGVLTGSPLTDVKITLIGGRAHEKHTEGGDFRESTYRAVRQGLMKAQSRLLEPYYSFSLELPVNLIGRAITDIRLMGGEVDEPQNRGDTVILCGKAPVITMADYMTEVVSYSGGRGRLSLLPAGYGICHNSEQVIEQMAYSPEHDLENTPDSVFCAHGAGFPVKWSEVEKYMNVPLCLK